MQKYASVHEQLDVKNVLDLIAEWLGRLESSEFTVNPLSQSAPPKLALLGPGFQIPD